jgi:ankyrin repeat protein
MVGSEAHFSHLTSPIQSKYTFLKIKQNEFAFQVCTMPTEKFEERKQIAHDDVKNSNMNADREFLTSIFESAVNADAQTLLSKIKEYGIKNKMTPFQVIKGFRDGSKRSAVHFSCQSIPKEDYTGEDVVQAFLKEFSTEEQVSLLEDVDATGFTPLILACQNMHRMSFDRIKYILSIVGKDAVKVRTADGGLALHYASGAGASKDIIKMLFEHGKDAIQINSKTIGTPLHWSAGVPASNDHSETLQTLIHECGADVNALNERGVPALILAAANGNDIHCKILVEHGADRGMILAGNVTVYHVAADLNMLMTLKAMIEYDAKEENQKDTITFKCLQTKSVRGEAPIDLAAQKGHLECFKLITGEDDNETAIKAMETLQNEWKEKKKNQVQDEASSAPQLVKTNFLKDEEEAHNAASRILLSPPILTEEVKAQAAEYKKKGNDHFAKKEYDDAISAYTLAIDTNPTDETFYSNRSACFMSMKKHKEALSDAVFARTLKPDWPKACYRMSVARLALEMYEDAAVSAYEGLNIDEDNAELRALFQKCVKKGQQSHKKHNRLHGR